MYTSTADTHQSLFVQIINYLKGLWSDMKGTTWSLHKFLDVIKSENLCEKRIHLQKNVMVKKIK